MVEMDASRGMCYTAPVRFRRCIVPRNRRRSVSDAPSTGRKGKTMNSTVYLHSRQQVGSVDPRVFGGFLEHIGRAVYEGVYEPQCRHADEHGFRKDVMAALKRLDMTTMRYPGGNFASGYHWMDGVGPQGGRPKVRELAWQSIETNAFGTDEYIALCRRMGWTPMLMWSGRRLSIPIRIRFVFFFAMLVPHFGWCLTGRQGQ